MTGLLLRAEDGERLWVHGSICIVCYRFLLICHTVTGGRKWVVRHIIDDGVDVSGEDRDFSRVIHMDTQPSSHPSSSAAAPC